MKKRDFTVVRTIDGVLDFGMSAAFLEELLNDGYKIFNCVPCGDYVEYILVLEIDIDEEQESLGCELDYCDDEDCDLDASGLIDDFFEAIGLKCDGCEYFENGECTLDDTSPKELIASLIKFVYGYEEDDDINDVLLDINLNNTEEYIKYLQIAYLSCK